MQAFFFVLSLRSCKAGVRKFDQWLGAAYARPHPFAIGQRPCLRGLTSSFPRRFKYFEKLIRRQSRPAGRCQYIHELIHGWGFRQQQQAGAFSLLKK